MHYYLGIDCGGTFIKAAIFDQNGTLQSIARRNIPIISEKPGYAERDMDELWNLCAQVIQKTIRKSSILPQQIKAIGISAQGKGAFFLNKDNKPLGRAILSSDQRAYEIVQCWQKENILQKFYPITLQTLWMGHPVSILRWIKENEPSRYEQIHTILMSHDYLRFCLTEKLYCEETNISESNFYNVREGKYDIQLAKLFGITECIDKLPPIIKSNKIAGYVTSRAAEQSGLVEGIPVVGGLFDVVSTALCADLKDDQHLNVVLGTWSVVSGVTHYIDDNQTIPFVYGKYPEKNKFIIHEASPTSAGNLEWFVNQFNLPNYDDINHEIAKLKPASSSVLFAPFLYGSNAKLGMQAGFYGIQSHHTQIHLLQAIYEGVIFSLMSHLERMQVRFPNASTLRVTGGPAKSEVWMQMLADISGMRLEIPNIEETGCLGAALMAMQAESAVDISQILNIDRKIFLPDKNQYSKYQHKYHRYLKFIEALKNLD
ncbi:FGGY-family carbohydrate kinase [Haemophilus influenzae]|uniref:FGGY-family carbohydrate kinase n=1 Tax=Haemophilus influenzae TaxID=727 RepID=UPI000E5960A8|nr:FGGY-family carbohydrate kinase [Haemophilus influenzae]